MSFFLSLIRSIFRRQAHQIVTTAVQKKMNEKQEEKQNNPEEREQATENVESSGVEEDVTNTDSTSQ